MRDMLTEYKSALRGLFLPFSKPIMMVNDYSISQGQDFAVYATVQSASGDGR